jgi:hypothetical protein
MNHIFIRIDENEGWISPDIVLLAEFDPFPFFHVDTGTDKGLIIVIGYGIIGKHIRSHPFAGATPGCISIKENQFIFLFCQSDDFLPGLLRKFDTPVL